ncbi:PREDICTED: transcriptional coactivator YAP1-like isoform X2 [Priapulus caudatus]|uniref:Transcriptional coactivator YAP1-like isoform X2 n=1 Tax=Priapulus caudatus TaxID=37621 RepID=A0ABM1EBM2_PRICU|nr:PREDICTED: transcriptional coactivator YAP1-like isoform X2 [Priapulus caudatus]
MEPKKGTQVIHVRGDSDSELEALFKVALSPDPKNHSLPMRNRKLPESFWKPPETGSRSCNHSRESSTDSTHLMRAPPPGLVSSHSRAQSSPASMQQSQLSTPQTPPHHSQHIRQHSEIPDHIPLPPGWEVATMPKTGQRYFIKNKEQQIRLRDGTGMQYRLGSPRNSVFPKRSHIEKSTTWTDPRLKYYSNMQTGTTLEPLPGGWEQATTEAGETYYINHINRTTSWFDPRLQPSMHAQRAGGPGGPGHLPPQLQQQPASQIPTSVGGNLPHLSPQARQQNLRLQSLQMERERLRQRQQEIFRQEMMLRNHLGGEERSTPVSTTVTGVVDPFLGSGGEYHARQESADSGLELGTNYSLPRTPEDFLGNVDEMDTSDGNQSQNPQQHSRVPPDFLDSMQGTNVDLGGLESTTAGTNMESDDLVPSLDINSDLLGDVEAVLNNNKIDNLLTWL